MNLKKIEKKIERVLKNDIRRYLSIWKWENGWMRLNKDIHGFLRKAEISINHGFPLHIEISTNYAFPLHVEISTNHGFLLHTEISTVLCNSALYRN